MNISWIKLSVTMFDDEKIKIIETMENGYEYITIWVKLLCIAGKKNDDGSIYLIKDLPLDQTMLAKIFGHNTDVFKSAIKIFEGLGMICIFDNGHIGLNNWNKYQDKLKSYEDVKEQNRLRQERRRLKFKISEESVSRDKSRDVTEQEREREREENKEEEEERTLLSPSNFSKNFSNANIEKDFLSNGTQKETPSFPSLPPLPPKSGSNLSKMKLGIKKILNKMPDFDELVNSKDMSIVDIMDQFSEYWVIGQGRDFNPQNANGLQSSFRKWIGYSGDDILNEVEAKSSLIGTSKLNMLVSLIKNKTLPNPSQRLNLNAFLEEFEEDNIKEIALAYNKSPQDGYDALITIMQGRKRYYDMVKSRENA